jgi:hypothetical protein
MTRQTVVLYQGCSVLSRQSVGQKALETIQTVLANPFDEVLIDFKGITRVSSCWVKKLLTSLSNIDLGYNGARVALINCQFAILRQLKIGIEQDTPHLTLNTEIGYGRTTHFLQNLYPQKGPINIETEAAWTANMRAHGFEI